MVGSRGGRSGVWWEYLGLFEKPFDAVFLLARSEVERGCKGVLMSLSMTTKTASVRAAKGAAMASQCRGV